MGKVLFSQVCVCQQWGTPWSLVQGPFPGLWFLSWGWYPSPVSGPTQSPILGPAQDDTPRLSWRYPLFFLGVAQPRTRVPLGMTGCAPKKGQGYSPLPSYSIPPSWGRDRWYSPYPPLHHTGWLCSAGGMALAT